MSYQLTTAKVWDGSAWVPAVGGGGGGGWYPVPVTTWSAATNVTADPSANVKGAWAQLVASTPADADCIDISIGGLSGNATNWSSLIDIGVGAAGSETSIISNMAVGGANIIFVGDIGWAIRVPVYIPSGSRIAARLQTVVAGGQVAQVRYKLSAGPNPTATSSTTTTIGSDTATSTGTQMSSSANTYVELAASTAATYGAVSIVPSFSGTSISNGIRQIELGLGAAGSETVVGLMSTYVNNAEGVNPQGPNDLVIRAIPAGSRLAAQVVSGATNQLYCCLIATGTLGT